MDEEWVTMNEASSILKSEGLQVLPSKLSRLASKNTIKTALDPLDERVRLVELGELRSLFGTSKRTRK